MRATPEIGKSIRAGGVLTNYHEAGKGTPVILIHGSGPGVSAWANWSRAIPSLAEHFHVLAYDQIGFGYTELPRRITTGWSNGLNTCSTSCVLWGYRGRILLVTRWGRR